MNTPTIQQYAYRMGLRHLTVAVVDTYLAHKCIAVVPPGRSVPEHLKMVKLENAYKGTKSLCRRYKVMAAPAESFDGINDKCLKGKELVSILAYAKVHHDRINNKDTAAIRIVLNKGYNDAKLLIVPPFECIGNGWRRKAMITASEYLDTSDKELERMFHLKKSFPQDTAATLQELNDFISKTHTPL